MEQLIDQIDHGKGKKIYNLFKSSEGGLHKQFIHSLGTLKSRLMNMMSQNLLFGLFMVWVNLIFVYYSWSLSGKISNQIWQMFFEGENMSSSGNSFDKKSF